MTTDIYQRAACSIMEKDGLIPLPDAVRAEMTEIVKETERDLGLAAR